MRIFAALVLAFLLLGCTNVQKGIGQVKQESDDLKNEIGLLTVERGDTVSVDYIGKLQDGTVFDTSIESEAKNANLPLRPSYEALTFTAGARQMIAGFDDAIIGMKEGDEKTVTLAPEQAYGQKSDDRIISIPVKGIGNSGDIKVGSMLSAENGAMGKVIEIKNETVVVDFNHELAGKTLVFTIKMKKIAKASK